MKASETSDNPTTAEEPSQPPQRRWPWDRAADAIREWARRHVLSMVVSILVLAFLLIYLAPDTFIAIYPGQAGVLWHRFFGGEVLNEVYGEGTHVIFPWDKMYIYNLRVHDIERTVHLLTINGLEVEVTLHVRVQLAARKLPAINESIGPDYEKQVVIPQMEQATRAVLSRYEPEQLHVSDEERLARDIQAALEQAPAMKLIGVEAVNITRIALPADVQKAIEEKNEEEQKSLLFDYRLQIARKEAERKKIEAQGIRDFEATLPKGISRQYLLLRAIQATEEIANSPNTKMVLIGPGQNGMPVIMGDQMGIAASPNGPKK